MNAWYNHRLEQAQTSGAAFAEFLTGDMNRHRQNVPEVWPEGITPEAVAAAADVEEQVEEDGSIESTALGQMLVREGVRQGRVSRPQWEHRNK